MDLNNVVRMRKVLTPRKYQAQAAEFLIEKKHAACWDSVGLGKTLTGMIAASPPTLVVCPTYLTEQWEERIRDQFPDQTVVRVSGSYYSKLAQLKIESDWTVINIEMLRNYELPREYKTVIIDESHHLRGREAAQSINAAKLFANTEYLFQLTATPIQKTPADIYMQLKILDPKRFKSYAKFEKEYLRIISTGWSNKVIGIRDPIQFRKLMSEYSIRRTYQDAGRDLPTMLPPIVIKVQPSKAWRQEYDKVRNQYRLDDMRLTNAMQVMQILRRLTACDEKLRALRDIVEDFDEHGGVIFTWYRDTAERIGRFLKIPVITGETNAIERVKIAKKNPVVVANISALKEGVDLSDKTSCVFFEEDYVPGSLEQAIGRIQRERSNGVTIPIRLFYIVVDKSIDMTVHYAVTERNKTVQSILKQELNADYEYEYELDEVS